jgi:hypothetical protein
MLQPKGNIARHFGFYGPDATHGLHLLANQEKSSSTGPEVLWDAL